MLQMSLLSLLANWIMTISFRVTFQTFPLPWVQDAFKAGEEPILWSGSVAENLDPSGTASEETLMQALRKAHLGFYCGPVQMKQK